MFHSIQDRQNNISAERVLQRQQQLHRELRDFRKALFQETQALRHDIDLFRRELKHQVKCELKQQVIELRLAFREDQRRASRQLHRNNQQFIRYLGRFVQALKQQSQYLPSIDITPRVQRPNLRSIEAGITGASENTVTDQVNLEDSPICPIATSITGDDIWTTLVKEHVEALLKQALTIELEAFIDAHHDHRADDGRQAVVRNGYLPERTIATELGTLTVRVPKTRDRSGEGIKFNSRLLPPYLKQGRSQSLSTLTWWYWHGMAVGDFYPLLEHLLGIEDNDDSDLVAKTTRERLHAQWRQAYLKRCNHHWSNLHPHRLQATTIWLDDERQKSCCLAIVATDDRHKYWVLTVGIGKTADIIEWKNLLIGLREQQLTTLTTAALSASTGPDAFREALYDVFDRDDAS